MQKISLWAIGIPVRRTAFVLFVSPHPELAEARAPRIADKAII